MPVQESIKALRQIADVLHDGPDWSSALGNVLSVIASTVPAETVALGRLHPESGVPEFVAGVGTASGEAKHIFLASAPYVSRQLSVGVQHLARSHMFAMPAEALHQAADSPHRHVTAFALRTRESSVDILLVATDRPIGPQDEATEFLSTVLMYVELFVAREREQRERSELHLQVERAKKEWETSVDSLPQLVCLLSSDGEVVRANRALERLCLGDVTRVSGTSFTKLLRELRLIESASLAMTARGTATEPGVHIPESKEGADGWLWKRWRVQLLSGPVSLDGLADRRGRVFDLRIQSCTLPDTAGGALRHYVAVLEDVTERNQARRLLEGFNKELKLQVADNTAALLRANRSLEREIEEHEEHRQALKLYEYRYHAFVENTVTGIYLAEEGTITYHNGRFASLLGYRDGELLGMRLADVLGSHCLQAARLDAHLNRAVAGAECQVSCRDGRRVWIRLTQAPYPESDRDIVIGNVLDITAGKEFEQRLIQAKTRTAQLSEQLLIALEQERRRIARDLHDGVGQRLNSIKFTLDQIISECAAEPNSKYRMPLLELASSLRGTLDEVRRVAMALRPSILDDLGIAATLAWFVREFGRVAPQIQVLTDIRLDEGAVGSLLKTEIFRIVQEAFTNIAKHAEADTARLSLIAEGDQLVLTIRDNGKGVEEGAYPEHSGVGLQSMHERAELTGGQLFVVARSLGGVAVIGRWPRGNDSIALP
jgi:PAS domain S-box-containing protein